GCHPARLSRGVDQAVALITAEISARSRPVLGHEDVVHVVAVAVQDDKVGELIADAVDKVGRDGPITVETGHAVGIVLETVEGLQFDRGYTSSYFVTNQDRSEAVLDEPFVLFTDHKLSAVADLLPVLEIVVKQGRPILIVAEDIEGEALATLVVNKERETLQCCAVKAPGFTD